MDELTSPARVIAARPRAAGWTIGPRGIALSVAAVLVIGWFAWSRLHRAPPPVRPAAALAAVEASKPLVRNLDRRIGFLGQFSAVDRVELRAQVGGELVEIDFRDGDLVHKGDLLFVVDPRPYDIQLASATAQLKTAIAQMALASQQLYRAQELRRTDFGTVETVDQRTADQRTAEAAIDAARAHIRDADFDLEHCRIAAPFTGRIGTHLVSIGNIVAGSRTASSPSTLLTTLVSQDPIHLDFDMSEADFIAFTTYHGGDTRHLAEPVAIALDDGKGFRLKGVLDFVDNALNRSSGTIHARATVPNPDLRLSPGQFARIRLVVAPPAPTLLVPDESVLPDQSRHVVMTVAADGRVVPKAVETGDLRGGLRVVQSGLDPQDQVITKGVVFAAPGSKVAPKPGTIAVEPATDADQD